MTDTLTIADIAGQILRAHNLKHGLTLKLGECIVRVKTNSVKLADKLGEYYTGLISKSPEESAITINAIEGGEPDFEIEFVGKQPDPGKVKIKEEYADLDDGRIIRKIITGMTFVTGAGFNIAIGQCAVNYNQIVNFINNRYI
jgi:HprK-related kinase B